MPSDSEVFALSLSLSLSLSIVDCCEYWYELMVGRLLFTSPFIISTDFDLVYAAEVSMTPGNLLVQTPEAADTFSPSELMAHFFITTPISLPY